MTRLYSSHDAAAELDTTPRTLRRFLRQNDSFKNATYAGRYTFTEEDLKGLRTQFSKWMGNKKTKKVVKEDPALAHLDEDKGISVEDMHKMNISPGLRAQVLARRAERWRKLDQRLIEVGVGPRELQDAE